MENHKTEKEEDNKEEVITTRIPKLKPVSKLFTESWEEYKAKFKGFMSIYLEAIKDKTLVVMAAVLLFLLLVSALASYFLPGFAASVFRVATILSAVVLAVYGGIYISTRAQIAIYFSCSGKTVDNKKSFSDSNKYFWGFFWLSLLVGLVVLLWALLFIIPGIIFGIFYSFVLYAFLFEDYNGWSAFKRSKELVSGYWWPVIGRFAVIGLISVAMQIPAMFIEDKSASANFYGVIISIVGLIIQPLFAVYGYKLYKELKALKGESKVSRMAYIDKK